MGWGDDFLTGINDATSNAASDAISNVSQSASDFVSSNVSAVLVKVGVAPAGNLSQAEIDAGHTGATPSAQKIATASKIGLPLIALAVGAYFFLFRKK